MKKVSFSDSIQMVLNSPKPVGCIRQDFYYSNDSDLIIEIRDYGKGISWRTAHNRHALTLYYPDGTKYAVPKFELMPIQEPNEPKAGDIAGTESETWGRW